MKITNLTKSKLISEKAEEPISFISKSIGLIGSKEPRALVLRTRFGIHTFGVRFPIDVLILNSDDRIVLIKENLRPLRFFVWNLKYDMVIELPSGTVEKTKTSVGDKLKIDA